MLENRQEKIRNNSRRPPRSERHELAAWKGLTSAQHNKIWVIWIKIDLYQNFGMLEEGKKVRFYMFLEREKALSKTKDLG